MIDPNTKTPVLSDDDVRLLAEIEERLANTLPLIEAAKACDIDVAVYDEAHKYLSNKLQQVRTYFGQSAAASFRGRGGG